MPWEFDNRLPIYVQLVDRLEQAIVSGTFAPGEKVDSVRELASQAGVNPNTMQRALSELERDGLLYTQRTSGRFITEDTGLIEAAKKALAQEQIDAFFQKMRALGFTTPQTVALVESAAAEEVR